MKIFLVSDATRFALTDIYNGYFHALQELKIPFEAFPYHISTALVSIDVCGNMIHSMALNAEKEFSHVMFIGGLNIKPYIFKSLYHVKSIVVGTEDPHSFDPLKRNLEHIDYYFSNERSVGNSRKYKNTYYCPTAGCTKECGKLPRHMLDEKYRSDILFLGALYPNRRKILEEIIPFVKRNKLSLKICGHVQYLPKSSPLWKYVTDARTIPHQETVKYYNGAKVVLNILRDIHWNPRSVTGRNPHNRSRFRAESLNPRAYEVPLCQAFMLLEDTRPEARELFTEEEVGFFSDGKSLKKQLKYFLLGPGNEKREEMAFRAFCKISEEHSYVNRMLQIKKILEQNENH